MEQRKLGATEIMLPAIGFGCGGNARLMVGDDEQLQIETIKTALESGINYFDTAGAYGDGRSEANLGRALRQLGAEPVISDKVNLQLSDLNDPRSAVLYLFDDGMARLGRTGVDVLMLHNRVFEMVDPGSASGIGANLTLREMDRPNGVIAAFQELISDGRVKAVGFTALGGDPAAIRELIATGVFGCINASCNLLNPSALIAVPPEFSDRDFAGVVPVAAEVGLGVMAIQVLASGKLATDAYVIENKPQLWSVVKENDDSVASASLRYVLSKGEISTAIVGFSEPKHVVDAVNALERGGFSEETLSDLERAAMVFADEV